MTGESNSTPPATDLPEPRVEPKAERVALVKLPGLIAIGLYMFLLAAAIVGYVVQGRAPWFYLVFSVFFIAGGLGLLFFLRWAWALTLAAVALMAGWCLWSFTAQHVFFFLLQGLFNLVFFFYLIRTDVRAKLR